MIFFHKRHPTIFKEKYLEDFVDTFSDHSKVSEWGATFEALLKPFLLRRTKAEVADSIALPQKATVTLFTTLSSVQHKLYRALLLKDVNSLAAVASGAKTTMANLLMDLRKCSNHPYVRQYR